MAVEVQNLPVAGDTNMNSQLRDRQNASSLDGTSVPGHINEGSYLLEGADNERSDFEAFGNDPADGVDTGKGWRKPSVSTSSSLRSVFMLISIRFFGSYRFFSSTCSVLVAQLSPESTSC